VVAVDDLSGELLGITAQMYPFVLSGFLVEAAVVVAFHR
jgi:hypothetical protein